MYIWEVSIEIEPNLIKYLKINKNIFYELK